MAEHIPLSPAQRSKIRRLAAPKEPAPGDEAGELNVIPYLDIIMNIIVFVIASLSVVFYSTITSTPPSIGGSGQTRTANKSKALNLSAWITSEGVSLKTSDGNVATGCNTLGRGVTVPKLDNDYDYGELSRCVRELKKRNVRFAAETQVTITANPGIPYQVVVSVLDALRADKDGPLFPNAVFGVAR